MPLVINLIVLIWQLRRKSRDRALKIARESIMMITRRSDRDTDLEAGMMIEGIIKRGTKDQDLERDLGKENGGQGLEKENGGQGLKRGLGLGRGNTGQGLERESINTRGTRRDLEAEVDHDDMMTI